MGRGRGDGDCMVACAQSSSSHSMRGAPPLQEEKGDADGAPRDSNVEPADIDGFSDKILPSSTLTEVFHGKLDSDLPLEDPESETGNINALPKLRKTDNDAIGMLEIDHAVAESVAPFTAAQLEHLAMVEYLLENYPGLLCSDSEHEP